MTDAIMISEVIRIDMDHIVETEDSRGKTEADPGMHKIIEVEISGVMQEGIKF